MSWTAPPGAYGSADPLFLLLIALAVEAYVGNRIFRFRWMPNPRRAVFTLVVGAERRLNRPQRGARDRRVRGALVAGTFGILALGVGWLAALVTRNYPFAWVVELFLLVVLLVQRATWQGGARVRDGLAAGSLIRAREALRLLTAGDLDPAALERLGEDGIGHQALVAMGRRFAERLVGPVFWYVVLGLPGFFLQQTADVMAAALSPGAGEFGRAPASLNRALSAPPRYLAGLLLAAAAIFVPSGNPRRVLAAVLMGRTGPPGALTGGAGAGPARARIERGLAILLVACLINAGLVALLALVRLAV